MFVEFRLLEIDSPFEATDLVHSAELFTHLCGGSVVERAFERESRHHAFHVLADSSSEFNSSDGDTKPL